MEEQLSDSSVEYQKRHIWTKQEGETLNQLVQQGFDMETISNIMNDIFQTTIFSPSCIKNWSGNPIINKNPFSQEEARRLMQLVREQVLKQSGFLWNSLECQFENRSGRIINRNFKNIVTFVLRRLNIFYGQPDKQIIYNRRITSLREVTLQLLFFFGQQNSQYYLYNQYITLIAQASKKIMEFVTYFVEVGYYYQTDVKYYFDNRPFENLEYLTSEQFNDIGLMRLSIKKRQYKTPSYRKNEEISDFKILNEEEVLQIRKSDTLQAIFPAQIKLYYKHNILRKRVQ